jgi:hypothetical protein
LGYTTPFLVFQGDIMETGPGPQTKRRCRGCDALLEGDVTDCPFCGTPAPSGAVPSCVVARGGHLDQDAVVTPTRRLIEKATADGRLTEEQGEYLLDLLIRVRPLRFDRRKEVSRVLTDIVRESDTERRRKALWALRGLLREIPAMEDAVHALFVKFEL